MYTDSLIVHIKAKYIYEDIAKDVEKMCDTLNYQLERLLPKEKKLN